MGFRMKITGGPEEITFDEKSITKVDFNSVSPADSNARATDFGMDVKVWGKMLPSTITQLLVWQPGRRCPLKNQTVTETLRSR